MECRDSSQKFCLGPQKPPDSLSSGPHSFLVSLCDVPGATLAMETQSEPVAQRKVQTARQCCVWDKQMNK